MGSLTEEQKQFYADNGFIVLDLLTQQEIAELSTEYDAIFNRNKKEDLEATWKGSWNKDKEANVSIYKGGF